MSNANAAAWALRIQPLLPLRQNKLEPTTPRPLVKNSSRQLRRALKAEPRDFGSRG
jgi:hypothetical protein